MNYHLRWPLCSDRVAALTGRPRSTRIVPFRGEYFLIRHFTRMILGGVEAGPNAMLALAREGHTRTDVSTPGLADNLSFPGLWRFCAAIRGLPGVRRGTISSPVDQAFAHTLRRRMVFAGRFQLLRSRARDPCRRWRSGDEIAAMDIGRYDIMIKL